MNKEQNNYESKFRELFQRTGLEKPSEGFTGNVLQQIEQLQAQKAKPAEEKDTWSKWIFIALSVIILSTGGFILYYYNISLLPENLEPSILPVFQKIFGAFKNMFESVQISSTTIVIIFGFIAIVVLERILNKLKVTKNIYFSF